MEGYIKKINDRIVKNHNQEKQQKIKKVYLLSGGLTLAIGLAGFVSSFITFIVLFLKFETDRAMIAWFVAIPFILMIVAGSVVTRIGDMLLKDEISGKNVEESKSADEVNHGLDKNSDEVSEKGLKDKTEEQRNKKKSSDRDNA